MTEAQREQRRYALAISGGVCEVCGAPLRDGQPQGAHRIGNTKANRAKYGDMVIDHPYNIGYTCSLKCNAELDISRSPAECAELCIKIYTREARKSCANCGHWTEGKDCERKCFADFNEWTPRGT